MNLYHVIKTRSISSRIAIVDITPETSIAIQDKLFSFGCIWSGSSTRYVALQAPIIYVYGDGDLTCSTELNNIYPTDGTITASQFLQQSLPTYTTL